MSAFSTALKISGAVALAAAGVWVGTKVSPTFAEKVGQAGGAIKDIFSKGAEGVAQAASTATDAGAAATDAMSTAAS